MAPERTDTIQNDTPDGPSALQRPLRALAYVGDVDHLDAKAPRLIWLENHDRFTIERPRPPRPLPEGRDDEVVVERGRQPRIFVRCRRVSAHHATLERHGDSWCLRDEGTMNGTIVNGEKIQEHDLIHGDVLEMGHTFWRYIEYMPLQPALFEMRERVEFGPTQTICPRLHEVLSLLALQAAGTGHQLILGETGVGKEITARFVHDKSGRKGKFHPINCAAIPPSSVDGYLFGWVKGAFTNAVKDESGHILEADSGTLVLDEIGTLPLETQATLLRVAEGEMYRLGDVRPRKVDIRIVASTNSDIPDMVRKGTFREDLYARLASHVTTLPPLRDRPEDIGGLVAQFLTGKDFCIQPAAMRKLLEYDWPLNVRQLHNTIQKAVSLVGNGEVIGQEHITMTDVAAEPKVAGDGHEAGAEAQVAPENVEQRAHYDDLLAKYNGNVAAVAREVGLQREQVYRILRRCKLDPKTYR